jgi:hypothetical protein
MYAYGIGKPTPAVNPDRLDVEEWQQHQQSTASPASLNAIVDAMPVATALTLLRGLLPVLEQRAAAQIVNVLENGPPPEDEDEVLENGPPPEDEDEPDLAPSAGPAYDDSRHLDLPAAGADEAGPDSELPVAAEEDDLETDVRASLLGDVPVLEAIRKPVLP